MKKVFLGGTCNGSKWRDDFIPLLKIDYFNPVVEEWTPEKQVEELRQREICDYCLYVITPKMKGAYSIAEAVDDSNKRPHKTIFCYLEKDEDKVFSSFQIKSMQAVAKIIANNKATVCVSLNEIAEYLNSDS